MTNTQVLTTAVEKAIKNGWNVPAIVEPFPGGARRVDNPSVRQIVHYHANEYESLIFNQDFAKALWKDEPIIDEEYYFHRNGKLEFGGNRKAGWAWHLQQMVIADDPLKYLADHL